jgi:hypothetical protein
MHVATPKIVKWHYILFFERYIVVFLIPPGVAEILKMS